MAFIAYGVRIGIRLSERGYCKRIRKVLPPGWKPTRASRVDHMFSLRVGGQKPNSRVRRFNLLYLDSARVARSMDLDEVLRTLEFNVQFVVSLQAKNRLFVHAGVVAWRDRAILIPGKSFSGKTTLVDALVRAGATYYSDEYAVLDKHGRVHAYPTPLALRKGRSVRLKKARRRVKPNGRLRPLRIGMVVVSSYKDGSTWRPRLLSPSRALLALLANTVAARVRPEFALPTLAKALDAVPVLEGRRGEAENVAEDLLSRMVQSDRRAA
jgi:hypothetical protein